MPDADPSRVRPAWLAAGAAVLAAAGCALIFLNQFTQDDASLLVASQRFASLAGWRSLFTEPFWPPPALPDLYRPLHALLLTVQSVVGSGFPLVFRIVTMLLYGGATAGVFVLARRWLAAWPAFVAAALFAVHPVHAEALVLAVAQNELLAGLLLCLAVALYLRAVRHGGAAGRDWVAIGAMYVAALLVNELAIVLPVLILVADRLAPRDAGARRPWAGLVALLVIAGAYVGVRAAVLHGAFAAPIVAEALRDRGPGGRMLAMLGVVPHWLRLLVWPAHLRADYSPREIDPSPGLGGAGILGVLLLVAVVALAWGARRKAPAVAFGLAWCGVCLLPVSNIVPGQAMISERTLLLASIGMVIAVVGGAEYLLGRFVPEARNRRWVAMALAGVVCALGLARTLLRERDWRDADALIAASLRDSPRSWIVQQSYGDLQFDRGNAFQGIESYQRAIALAPERWRVRNRLGIRLRMINDDYGGARQFESSLAESPGRIETVVQLAAALISIGRYEDARRLADSVIRDGPAPASLVTMRSLADTAIAQKIPAGLLNVPPPMSR